MDWKVFMEGMVKVREMLLELAWRLNYMSNARFVREEKRMVTFSPGENE